MTSMAPWVADYIEAGYEIFPLNGKLPHAGCPDCSPRSPRYRQHRGADCAGTPGHELCHGLLAATSDLEQVAKWWTRWPMANIGARVPRSLVVLDVDPRHGGHEQLAQLEAEHGALPPTRTSYSGRGDGGHHRWFLHPGGKPSASRLGAGLDLKTYAGYVLLPPSRHPATGRPYWWGEPLADPVAMSAWFRRLLQPPAPRPPVHLVNTFRADDGPSIADAYSTQTSWRQILEPHGWTCPDLDPEADGARWRHPSASHQVSASIRHGCLFVYSQATDFEATEAGDPHGYTKFRAYAVLDHGGDLSAAAKALRETS